MIPFIGLIIILLLAAVAVIIIIMKRKENNKKIDIDAAKAKDELRTKQQNEAGAEFRKSSSDAAAPFKEAVEDVDIEFDQRFLSSELETPSKTQIAVKVVARTARDMGFGIAPDVTFGLSKKLARFLSRKSGAKIAAKAIAKTVPKFVSKASMALAKSASKLTNPIGWALMSFDVVSLGWDLFDVGKLSNIKLAEDWIRMRDNIKNEFDKNVGENPPIIGPITKLKLENEKKYLELVKEISFKQDTILREKLITSTPNWDDLSLERQDQLMESIPESVLDNATMKALCVKLGGKYLGRNLCSYSTKSACDNSYSWPPKEGDLNPYVQWDGKKCVGSFGGLVRHMCDEEGTANIKYDYNDRVCKVKAPYCKQFGYQFKEKDENVLNYPNCYKTTGRLIADALAGETISKDFENLFSSEKNCGNRCGPNQYCYTVTGRGGICLPKSKVGEACPFDSSQNPCEGESKCKPSSEGILALSAAAISTTLGPIGPILGGRAASANLGLCTAGIDGKNPPSKDNPGHYIPLGMKGCSAVWPCPQKVKGKDGKTRAYYCSNAFTECQPPKKLNESCGPIRKCEEGLWCGGVPIKCRKPGDVGAFCPLKDSACKSGLYCGSDSKCARPRPDGSGCFKSSGCQSGQCIGGICGKKFAGKFYIPNGKSCILANSRCEPGTYCNGFTCVPQKDEGGICATSGECLSNTCERGATLETIATLGIAGTCTKPKLSDLPPALRAEIEKRIEEDRTGPVTELAPAPELQEGNNQLRVFSGE
tara:strand:+ start:9543 stop:11837 length:2295 start_codon:yes stop_codon:yes gene_type:complete